MLDGAEEEEDGVIDVSHEGLTDDEAIVVVQQAAASPTKPASALLLDGNRLTLLPAEISKLGKSLRWLALSDNLLSTLPAEIGELRSLESLELSGNCLVRLPDSLGHLRSLTTLRLGGNLLTELPEALEALSSLRTLGLNCNRLAVLPNGLKGMSSLQSLRLHANRLPRLSDSIGSLGALQSLALGANQLCELPDASLRRLVSLRTLALNTNRLSSLPDALGCLVALQSLSLDGNSIGRLPDSIGALGMLLTLSVNGNELEALPSAIGQCTMLRTLTAGANRLKVLPASLCNLLSLQTLWLPTNMLTSLPALPNHPAEPLHNLTVSGNDLDECAALASLRCRALWIDAAIAVPSSASCARIIRGTVEHELPYLNFWQKCARPQSQAEGDGAGSCLGRPHTLIVAFGVSGFDFGGVISRSGAEVDLLFLFDQRHTSYLRDEGALRNFLQRLRSQHGYARVGAVGSSQSAFGAIHYLDAFDAVLAISPLDSHVDQHRHLSPDSGWLPRCPRTTRDADSDSSQHPRHIHSRPPRPPCRVTIHVAEDNFVDIKYAKYCEDQHQRQERGHGDAVGDDASLWALRVVTHPGAMHPAYPGDETVHAWVHSLVAMGANQVHGTTVNSTTSSS
jgi:Leucine-rich repeat (LRR) protein